MAGRGCRKACAPLAVRKIELAIIPITTDRKKAVTKCRNQGMEAADPKELIDDDWNRAAKDYYQPAGKKNKRNKRKPRRKKHGPYSGRNNSTEFKQEQS